MSVDALDLICLLLGGALGYLYGHFFSVNVYRRRVEHLQHERDVVQAELTRLTDRDERGRFTRREGE